MLQSLRHIVPGNDEIAQQPLGLVGKGEPVPCRSAQHLHHPLGCRCHPIGAVDGCRGYDAYVVGLDKILEGLQQTRCRVAVGIFHGTLMDVDLLPLAPFLAVVDPSYYRDKAVQDDTLGEAVAPFGGIVMWRAFVYSPTSPDRANQAVEEFLPLDGQFADNVIVQIKNGPVDFQPREPFSPLFGQLRDTKMMMEFQITQEYLGFSHHLAYHGTTWEECLDSDTYRDGPGSTVAKMVTAIAGVANTGQDPNFCGYFFAQANWYAFGRLAWNPELDAEQIADEWIRQTFLKPAGVSDKTYEAKFIAPVRDMMMASREAVVNYEMPLGLHHLFGGTHYGPAPWDRVGRPDWTPAYYHKADSLGIGFDRTPTGSDNVHQYHEPLTSTFADLATCPENLLLWFHHLPWDYKLSSGRTLWDEICLHYDTGIRQVEEFRRTWDGLEPYVSPALFAEAKRKLEIQQHDAEWWRDACVGYFQTFSKRPLPSDVRPLRLPIDSLEFHQLKSDELGMPVFDDDLRAVILPPRRMMRRPQ